SFGRGERHAPSTMASARKARRDIAPDCIPDLTARRARGVRPVVDDLVVTAARQIIEAERPGVGGAAVHHEQARQLASPLDIAALAELDANELDPELALLRDLRQLAAKLRAAVDLLRRDHRDQPAGDREQEQRDD